MFAYSYQGFQPSAATPVIETTIGKRKDRKINEALLEGKTTHNQNLKEFTSQYMEHYTAKKGEIPEWMKRRQREANREQARALEKSRRTNKREFDPESGIGALMEQEGNKLPKTVTDEDAVAEAQAKGILATDNTNSNDDDKNNNNNNNNGELGDTYNNSMMTMTSKGETSNRRLPRAHHEAGGEPIVRVSKSLKTNYEKNFKDRRHKATISKPKKKKYQTAQERVHFLAGTHDTTTYHRDLGKKGFNPRTRLGNLHSVEEISSTMELNNGSAKSTAHVPGYTGHVPTDNKNRRLMHDKGEDYKKQGARDQLKMNMLHDIPGYAGFKPQAEMNYRERPVNPGKQTLNTESYDEKQVEVGISSTNGISSKCMQDFFVLEANTSADGMASAQKFFANYRPLEGMIKLK